MSDATELTMRLMRLAKEPHCIAETEENRPFQHWETHCANCGVHMTRPHVRTDCPKQGYEQL